MVGSVCQAVPSSMRIVCASKSDAHRVETTWQNVPACQTSQSNLIKVLLLGREVKPGPASWICARSFLLSILCLRISILPAHVLPQLSWAPIRPGDACHPEAVGDGMPLHTKVSLDCVISHAPNVCQLGSQVKCSSNIATVGCQVKTIATCKALCSTL